MKRLVTKKIAFSRRQCWGLVIGAAAGVVILSVWYTLSRQPQATKTVKAEVVTHSTDAPSEDKPGGDYAWRGGADDPKKLTIPSVGIDAYVQNVGVDQNQQIAVPNNIHIAGWFVDSVRPGQKGLSIIDGHVDGRTVNEGVFAKLGKLKEGGALTVEMGSGSVLRYRVHKITTVATDKATDVLYSQIPSINSQLNLITCTGTYLKDQKTYDQRTIVAAELMQ